jgi:hypothetical protein
VGEWYVMDSEGRAVPSDIGSANDENKLIAVSRTSDRTVSTVFLRLDHDFYGGPPVLWETMLFCDDPELDNTMKRYTSIEAAMSGHIEMCEQYLPAGYTVEWGPIPTRLREARRGT